MKLFNFTFVKKNVLRDIKKEIHQLKIEHGSTPRAPISFRLQQEYNSQIYQTINGVSIADLYELVKLSDVLSNVIGALNTGIIRPGWDIKEKFKVICENEKCAVEFQNELEDDVCPECKVGKLREPDEKQKISLTKFLRKVNKNRESFKTVQKQFENDLNTADRGLMMFLKEYSFSADGDIIDADVTEILRGDPTIIFPIYDRDGIPGQIDDGVPVFTCPVDRHEVFHGTNQTHCPKCGFKLQRAYYYSDSDAQGSFGVPTKQMLNGSKRYFIDGELIQQSKYHPNIMGGFSPVFAVWQKTTTLLNMDRYVLDNYAKQRSPKGFLVASVRNFAALTKAWNWLLEKTKKNPHTIHPIGLESEDGKGGLQYVKLMDTLAEMQYIPARVEMKQTIGAVFGVMPIFQADLSNAGGLNNEGLQIKVTNEAIDLGHSIYDEGVFPEMLEMLKITDWIMEMNPSEETDEMAELQRDQLEIANAESMLRMGFNVERTPEGDFKFSGEANPAALPQDNNSLTGLESTQVNSLTGAPSLPLKSDGFIPGVPDAFLKKKRLAKPVKEIKTGSIGLEVDLEKELNKIKKELSYQRTPNKQQIKTKVDRLLSKLSPRMKRIVDKEINKIYKDSLKEVEKQLSRDIGFGETDSNAIKALSNSKTLSKAYTGVSSNLSKELNKVITDAYSTPGKLDLNNMVKEMKKTINASDFKLERIARTETQAVSNTARELSYDKVVDPNKKFKWIGPADNRTTPICESIKARSKKGVSLEELKQIISEEADSNIYKSSRPFTPHLQCRHVLLREV